MFSLELHRYSRDYHWQHDFVILDFTELLGKLVCWIQDSSADSAG